MRGDVSRAVESEAPEADGAGAGEDELGAHVSVAGGVANAPGRAVEIGARVCQVFTKQPNRWAERGVTDEEAAAFREARERHGIRCVSSHDSYLINLASPDPVLFRRSLESFRMEVSRCVALGLEYLVTHPGNATDGDRRRGLRQNAQAIRRVLDDVPGPTTVLLEITAGTGSALGRDFEELAFLLDAIGGSRVGVCLDTCHLWAAGYDLAGAYHDVIDRLDDLVGLEHVRLFHLNDSATPFGSRRDRHAHIGAGSMGLEPFRHLLRDGRFAHVPKLLETPKDDDQVAADRMNLDVLRGLRASGTR